MLYKGYMGKVQYDDEAKLVHGEVIGIRDVITFQADSASDIRKAFFDSVDDYLAFCKSRGEEPAMGF
jgi:predicted HicB family RNase H-like nuclease